MQYDLKTIKKYSMFFFNFKCSFLQLYVCYIFLIDLILIKLLINKNYLISH